MLLIMHLNHLNKVLRLRLTLLKNTMTKKITTQVQALEEIIELQSYHRQFLKISPTKSFDFIAIFV